MEGSLLEIAVIAALVLINAIFVAAEYSSPPRSRS
jgi:hypothetical protein